MVFLNEQKSQILFCNTPCSWNFYRCQWKMSIYTRVCLNIGFAVVQLLSCVWLFCDPTDCRPCPQDFPGKNTGAGCHFSSRGSIKYYFYIEIIYNLKHLTIFFYGEQIIKRIYLLSFMLPNIYYFLKCNF